MDQAKIALVGAGRIGSHHARAIAREVPGADLVAVVDPVPGAARTLADELGTTAYGALEEVLDDVGVQGVVVTTPAALHTEVVLAAARRGWHVFAEKPLATTLADVDACIEACASAGVRLQVGFNRRFAPGFVEARSAVTGGRIGTPQLLRSCTRDPGPYGGDPARTPAGTIFLETLIHDFDMLLWLNPGAEVVTVAATADALVRPDAKDDGFLDTAVVTLRFDNGAIATADASFQAAYGYDVRAEVFGDGGMATMGSIARTDMTYFGADGVLVESSRADTELLHTAFVAECQAFADQVLGREVDAPTGEDGRRSLLVALAAIASAADGGRPVSFEEVTR